jgi:integrase
VLPTIGEVPVTDIDEHMVLKILEPIWLTKTATAKRVRGEIEQVLSWSAAKPRCYRPTGPNPASWRGNLEHSLPKPEKIAKVKHRPALPWQDMRDFFAVLRQHNSIAAMALQFTILTAGRTDEVRLMPWAEINLKHRVWQIPALRMKADRPHRVPLSYAAI